MRLFNRKKVPLTVEQEAVAERIAEGLIRRQKKVADYLNAKTKGISGEMWQMLLVGFCLVFGGYCLYLVIAAWS